MGQGCKSFTHFGKWLRSSALSTSPYQQSKSLKTSNPSGTAFFSEEYIEALSQPSVTLWTNPEPKRKLQAGEQQQLCGSWRLESFLCCRRCCIRLPTALIRTLTLPGQGESLNCAQIIHVLAHNFEPTTAKMWALL